MERLQLSFFTYGEMAPGQMRIGLLYLLIAALSELLNGLVMHFVFWRLKHGLNVWIQLTRYMQKPVVGLWIIFYVAVASISAMHSVKKGEH